MNRPKRGRIDGELVWTFSLSFAAHAVLLVLFLAGPNRYLQAAAPPIESYTVELIAPGVVGGNDGPVGPIGAEPVLDPGVGPEVEPPLEPPATDAEEPEVEEYAEPEPVVEAEAPEPVLESSEPEPVAEEPEPVAEEPEPVAEEPEPVAEEPEPVAEEPEPVAEEPEPVAEEPEPVAEVNEPEPEVVVEEPAVEEPEPEEKVVEKPPEKPKPVEVAKPKAEKKAAAVPKPAVRKATPPAQSNPVEDRDRRIAEAIGRRAAKATAPSVDDRIAAAVKRRATQVSPGGGGSGGPLSSGPGSGGGGGTVIGAEYILYKRRMEARIRDAWIWAGTDDGLESVVRFAVAPDGQVENVRTTRPSGDRAYDASAERAVEAASPLGMVPDTYRREFADVEMTFRAVDLRR